jgi:hypothetical protein
VADLTTLANAKAWLAVSGNGDDDLLSRLVSAISAAAESYMNRTIGSAVLSYVRHGNGKTVIPFPNAPVTAVTSVTVDAVTIPARIGSSGPGYAFDDGFLYLSGYSFAPGVNNVAITNTGGFAKTPMDLEQAVLDWVAFKYRERDRIGLGSKILQGETITFLRDVPPSVLRVFNQYSRVAPST